MARGSGIRHDVPTGSPPSPRPLAAWILVLVATSTMTVSYVDRQAVAALAPTITKDLGISDSQFGWLGSAFSLSYLVFAPLAGRWIDRVGARVGLQVSVLVWSLVAAAHALVPGLTVLFLLRVLLGAAEAPSFPGAAQTVTRALPPEQRSAGYGVLFTGSSIGAALSAVIAPTLAAWWGWRIALVGTAVVGLGWLPLWWAATRGPEARAALEVRTPPAGDPPPGWRELLGDRAVWRAVAAVVASAPVVGLVLQFGAKILVAQHGITQTDVRTYLWLPPLAFDAGAILFGFLATRTRTVGGPDARGIRHPPPRALFLAASSLALAIGAIFVSTSPWQTTAACAVALAGGGGMYALATADMLSRVSPHSVAAAGGITAAAQSLALIVAFPLVGRAAQSQGTYGPIAVALALWLIPGVLVWLGVDPRGGRKPVRAS